MELTTSHYTQLIVGLTIVMAAFATAYVGPERPISRCLFLLIPFQPVVSKYGSLNTGLALLVFTAFLLSGRLRRFPLALWVAFLGFAYMLSFSQAPRPTFPDHTFYMIAMLANIAVFWIFYNHTVRMADASEFLTTLVWLNVLVAGYCGIQLLVGVGATSGFGVSELSMQANRADARLVGPFAAVGVTAEYLVIQVFILFYLVLNKCTVSRRCLYIALIVGNFAFLVATGNRGGALILVLGILLFFLFFKRDFGLSKLLVGGVVGGAIFGAAALMVVSFTDFNVLFERIVETEVQEGLPDSRSEIWPLAWDRIKEAPILGHGPRVRLIDEEIRKIPGLLSMPYPHSLYLFILYAVGVVGFVAYLGIFVAYHNRLYGVRNSGSENLLLRGIPKLALLILILVAVDQVKVSALRFSLTDYQQFLFALLGGLLGLSEATGRTGSSSPRGLNSMRVSVTQITAQS